MMVIYPRCGLLREVNSVSKHSSVSRSSRPVARFPSSIWISICGRLRYDADPQTIETCGARSKIFSPSCWATHPRTAKFFVIGEAMKHLLLGFIADGASVVEDQAGVFDGRNRAVALGNQHADDLLG